MNVDPAIIRILFAIITFGGFGFGVIAYLLLWIVLPSRDLEYYGGKRLYRNPGDRVFGGVASGIAAYFKREAWTIRLIFAAPILLSILLSLISWPFYHEGVFVPNVVFGSLSATFIFAYIILWIVLPEAHSDYQRMEMKGEKVDVHTIRQNVKDRAKEFSEDVKTSAQNIGNKAKEFVPTMVGCAAASPPPWPPSPWPPPAPPPRARSRARRTVPSSRRQPLEPARRHAARSPPTRRRSCARSARHGRLHAGLRLRPLGRQPDRHPDHGRRARRRKRTVRFDYADESDAGPYPIPANVQIEGGGDRHVLIVDRDACKLYELYAPARASGGGWHAGSGAIWSLRSNPLRPAGWTSADAAGLPILPGLARYDEVARGRDRPRAALHRRRARAAPTSTRRGTSRARLDRARRCRRWACACG